MTYVDSDVCLWLWHGVCLWLWCAGRCDQPRALNVEFDMIKCASGIIWFVVSSVLTVLALQALIAIGVV